MTHPMMTSSTSSGLTPARRTLSRTTKAPSCVAVKPFREPWNFPVGVRAALMMTASLLSGMISLLGKNVEPQTRIVNRYRQCPDSPNGRRGNKHLRFTFDDLRPDYTLERGGVKQAFRPAGASR